MKFFSIKYKLLFTFAVFLVIITLCNAVLTSCVVNRRGEEEAFAQLSRQLRLFRNDLEEIREIQVAVALEAARDEKNLSDLAILYDQSLKLRQASGTVLEQSFSLNKATSLNRLQLILSSARLSSAAAYLEGELSHYVTQDEAGMLIRRGGEDVVVSSRQKEGGKVQLATWRTWAEASLPVLVARRTPVVDRVTVAFEFPADHLMVLQVVVPIQGVLRESFLETITEHLTIAAPETLLPPGAGGKAPEVIGMFVFSKVFDTAFLKETATNTGLFPAILSPDGQHGLQLLDVGRAPAELLTAQDDAPIQSQTVKIGQTSYYQAFMPWWIDGQPALILGFALSREGVLATIRQTVIGITTAAGLILVIGGALGYLLIARLVMPITSLTAAVSAMEIDDADGVWPAEQEKTSHVPLGRYLERPIAPQHGDEIGELTRAFNALAAQLYQSFATLEERVRSRTSELAIAKKQAEEAQRAAEAASQAKSTFLSNMSHELRTPLNAILGFAQVIARSRSLSSDQQENLGIIRRSGEHLLTLINQVLDLSKIEAGRMTLNAKDFDLHRLVHDVQDMFALKADIKGLQLLFEQDESVPRYVCTDEVKLRQVLVNLLNNAVKFTEEGGVAVRVRSEARSLRSAVVEGTEERHSEDSVPHYEHIQFEIEDSGPGIAPEEMEQVFEAFGQTGTGRQSQEGTGLGLPISRKFVQLMGGDMRVKSEVGHGTLFSFDIQVQVVEAAAFGSRLPTRRVVALEPGQPRYRILIVDDHWTDRQVVVKLLSDLGPPRSGFELREAANGQEAIEIWDTWKPHLILMDMRMPVLDGYEATKRIKNQQSTIIIALTASSFEEERAVVLNAGCDDYLRKPFREAELFDLMSKHIGVRFIYEEEKQSPIEKVLTPEMLAALPAEWLATLKQGAEEADVEMLLEVIEQIRERDAALAAALARLAEDFEYDEILEIIP